MSKKVGDVRRLVLALLDQGFNKTSWHGPNLSGALRGVSPEAAVWRPAAGRHNIAEQALHAAYWKYTVRRRLTGEQRGSFPLKGSNWFPVDGRLSEGQWREHLALLEEQHRRLRAAAEELDEKKLLLPAPGGRGGTSKVSAWALLSGIAAHDVYHAGQIQLLRRMQERG